jgi:hypothetical protein
MHIVEQKGSDMLAALKWTATALLIVGFGGVAAGFQDFIYIQMAGGVMWLTASVIMRDRPLIVTNGVMTLAGIAGLVYRCFG